MPHPTDEKYFHTLKEWSERKLKLLENYLEPATRIMKSIHPTVYYVDCFAGRGTYGRPGEPQIPGSPIRAAQLAQGYIDEGKPYSLRCINVESDPKIFQGLQGATANYSHITQNFQGTFVDNINNILSAVGSSPAVVFLDPFGVDGMDWDAIQRLIRRQDATDLWIRLDVNKILRRAGYYDSEQSGAFKQFDIAMRTYGFTDRQQLNDILNDPKNKDNTEQRQKVALDLYLKILRDEFKKYKREGYVEAYRIGSLKETIKYYLVFATASKKGITLASGIVHSAEQNYQRDIEESKSYLMPSMFEPTEQEIEDAKIARVRDGIIKRWSGKSAARISIHASLLNELFGTMTGSHLTKALRGLVQDKIATASNTKLSEDTTIFSFKP